MDLIFLLMGIVIGLTSGGLISLVGLESKEEKKTVIKKEVVRTIDPEISLFEYMYDEWKSLCWGFWSVE